MSITQLNSILIIDTNQALTVDSPFESFLPNSCRVVKSFLLDHTLRVLTRVEPDAVLLTPCQKTYHTLRIMEALCVKSHNQQSMIPLLLSIDVEKSWSEWPGTYWGDHFGIVLSTASKSQFLTELGHTIKGRPFRV